MICPTCQRPVVDCVCQDRNEFAPPTREDRPAWGQRRALPPRRAVFQERMEFAQVHYILGYGYYPDGAAAEMFVNTYQQMGSQADATISDAAIVVSLALQYGCPLAVLREALRRNPNGSPSSPVGAFLDKMPATMDEVSPHVERGEPS